ncbi:hypothetical protein B0P06_000374 [Clostridium saccharoperbutylacetonicum]|nr:hypothetical protein [Clostridium saccharoperbutylacetonicum]NSB40603.1 hypothetical protein [Clostridium saccharoperbutylacetonicum]
MKWVIWLNIRYKLTKEKDITLGVNKLHSKIQADRTGKHLFKLKKTA